MTFFRATAIACAVFSLSNTTQASLMFDQELSGGVFFGSGNADGGWTVDTDNNIELGLRSKLRFDENNQPQNQFNSNGDGTYTFDNVAPPTGFSWQPNSASSAIWNFEFSIDVSGTGLSLTDFIYELNIDFDPTVATNFFQYDPVNSPNDNDVQNSTAQNSWNMEFFDSALYPYTNTDIGVYDIELSAFDRDGLMLASTRIQVNQGVASVPVPSAALLTLPLLAGLLVASRRKKQA